MTIPHKLKEKIRELYNKKVSKSEIARRLKVSRPVIIEACKEVDNMTKTIPTEIDSKRDGIIAAEAFKLFRAGKRPDEVVIKLREPPEKILFMYDQWTKITRWPSGHMYENLRLLAKKGCPNCRGDIQPLDIVSGYCIGCNRTAFLGNREDYNELFKGDGFIEYYEN